jgi:hypothetical protein
MKKDDTRPNRAANKAKAEGDREDDNAGGITNRPLDEEEANQNSVPDRGESRDGAHAGHGDDRKERGR